MSQLGDVDAADPGDSLQRSLTRGRRALEGGDWAGALEAFARITEDGGLDDELLAEAAEGAGLAAYWLDDVDRAVECHELAFHAYRRLGRPGAAARMAFWLSDDHLSFLGAAAVAGGWIERGERLLAEAPDVPERVWLPLYQGHYALQVDHDPERALALAGEALELAKAVGAPEAEVIALALQGLALVVRGEVSAGMPLLDEASAAAVSRRIRDLNVTAWAFCYLIQGCDTVRDVSRAAEWCRRVMAFCQRWGLGPIFTACRTRYASLLTWQGEWGSAERQIEEMLARRSGGPRPPIVERSARIRLAEVRLRQGRLDEAERMYRDAGEHRSAVLGRAAVALARDEPEVTVDLADRVLRMLPPSARAERSDALLLRILALARIGRTEQAEEDLEELSETAERLATAPLRAAAAHARGAVAAADRDPAAALAAYEDALAEYDRGGAPQEAARIRLELAGLLVGLGRETTARREAGQARDAFESLGAAADLERAERFLRGLGGTSGLDPEGALPLTDREIEVLQLVGRGLSNKEIAERLFISPHTVKRHIANILRKLDCPSRAAAVAQATRAGVL